MPKPILKDKARRGQLTIACELRWQKGLCFQKDIFFASVIQRPRCIKSEQGGNPYFLIQKWNNPQTLTWS